MEREVSELIDKALARRSSLLQLLSRATSSSDGIDALSVQYQIAELDGLLALVARTSTVH